MNLLKLNINAYMHKTLHIHAHICIHMCMYIYTRVCVLFPFEFEVYKLLICFFYREASGQRILDSVIANSCYHEQSVPQ